MSTTTYTVVNGQVLRQNKDGVVSHFVSDPLGSVVMVRDNAGNTVYEAEYDPYGNVQSETGTNPSEFGYVGTLGYVKDSAFSLYVRARYLLTNLGRWLTKDPLWPSEPGFVYGLAAPVSFFDATGTTPLGIGDLFHGQYCGAIRGTFPDISAGARKGAPEVIGDFYYTNPPKPFYFYLPPSGLPVVFPRPGGSWGRSTCMNDWPPYADCLDRLCITHDFCLSPYDEAGSAAAAHCHCTAARDAESCYGKSNNLMDPKIRIFIETMKNLCKQGKGGKPRDEDRVSKLCDKCLSQARQACKSSAFPGDCFNRYKNLYCKAISPTCGWPTIKK